MHTIDLNLLVALEVLLEEESVTRAAKRMGLSAPAMSRSLTRIRDAVGDPILVRAGRQLVPTPRALALRPHVRQLIADARALLASETLELASLRRTFVIRTNDAVAAILGVGLVDACRAEAPGVVVRFAAEGDEDTTPLRDGVVDLDIGVIRDLGPEIHVQSLLEGGVLGVVRRGHPLLEGPLTMKRYAAGIHLTYSRKGKARGPIDDALAAHGMTRVVGLVVPSFLLALHVVATSDVVGILPSWLAGPATDALGLVTFTLPVPTPPLALSHAWHPRFDADPAHRWLRARVQAHFAGVRAQGDAAAPASTARPRSGLRPDAEEERRGRRPAAPIRG